ncbi:MAG: hypothetical protein IJA10_13950 [Lachnospiraceae bacterium]|nr:hypothetical protein [Lachnospiraceae bacterium]
MGKIIISRENDKGKTSSIWLSMIVTALIGGFGGIPIGAILSGVMQNVLDDSSAPVMYGFFALPIVLGMIIVLFVVMKDMDLKSHTHCFECKHKLQAVTELDALFYIPAEEDQKYENPLPYLAQNMIRISSVQDIPPKKRGCYVCCYSCPNCSNRIVRIADFLPKPGSCQWKESYYFDLQEFVTARGKNDLI